GIARALCARRAHVGLQVRDAVVEGRRVDEAYGADSYVEAVGVSTERGEFGRVAERISDDARRDRAVSRDRAVEPQANRPEPGPTGVAGPVLQRTRWRSIDGGWRDDV